MAHFNSFGLSPEATAALQERLLAEGKYLGLSGEERNGVDGIFGKLTGRALHSLPRGVQERLIKESREAAARAHPEQRFAAKPGQRPVMPATMTPGLRDDAPAPAAEKKTEIAPVPMARGRHARIGLRVTQQGGDNADPGAQDSDSQQNDTATYIAPPPVRHPHLHKPKPAAAQAAAPIPAAGNKTAVFDMKTGRLILPNGKVFDAGSGKGQGKDNPAMEGMRDRGPIPEGVWQVGRVAPHSFRLIGGRVDTTPSMALSPTDQKMALGRGGFLIHHMHSANLQSIGCLVLSDKDMKELIAARNDGVFDKLHVTRDASLMAKTGGPGLGKQRQFAMIKPPSPFNNGMPG